MRSTSRAMSDKYRSPGSCRWAEYRVNQLPGSVGLKRRAGHQPSVEDRSEQRRRGELRVEVAPKLAFADAALHEVDQRLASFCGVSVVEAAHSRIALGALDQGRNASRERRVDDNLC